MMPDTVTPHDLRRNSRTHIFLGALLKSPVGNCAARIRNISRTGALIEASILPEAGTPVRLVRGSLEAAGETVWRSGGRCGIAFESHVCVESWLPDWNGRQAQVDALLDDIRKDSASGDLPDARPACETDPDQAFKTLADLARTLGRQFASDSATVARFSSELQGFDILAQALEALGARQPGGTRRLADTVSACRELLLRLDSDSGDLPEPVLVRTGSASGWLETLG
jgi:hypothetical protein